MSRWPVGLPMSLFRATVPAMRKLVNSTRLMTSLSTSSTLSCTRAWLLPIMAAHTRLVFPGSHRHQDRCTYGVAQADDSIGERGSPIEAFDSRFQVAQFAERPFQA